MTNEEFLKLMKFPVEWLEWGMYSDELFQFQVARYEHGHEDASEHDRNGAFHWWIKRNPSAEQLQKLFRLARLDPDSHMAIDVLTYLRQCENYDPQMEAGGHKEKG